MASFEHLARKAVLELLELTIVDRALYVGSDNLSARELPGAILFDCDLHQFPTQQPRALVDALASLYHQDPNNLIVCRGVDEGIDLLLRTFCQAREDSMVLCPPMSARYTHTAQLQEALIHLVPLRAEAEFTLDVDEILASWQPNHKLILLCSPNNPSGNVLKKERVLELCSALDNKAIVVVDESFIEFSQYSSLLKDRIDHPNLVLLRTLSQAYGLAGARCGAIIGHPKLIELVHRVLPMSPIPTPVVEAALSVLDMRMKDRVQEAIDYVIQERNDLSDLLSTSPFIEYVYPSESMFIMVKLHDPHAFYPHCEKEGVLLKRLESPYCRITIGTQKQNSHLKNTLSYEFRR